MLKLLAAFTLVLAGLVPAIAQAQPTADQPGANVLGNWVNPHGTLKVQVGNCGNLLCAWVVEASPYQQSAAQKAGIAKLLGTNLLEGVRPTSPGSWEGKVFVPERGDSYFTRIRQLGRNELRISGCILGGLFCKSEVWRRA